MPNHNKIQGSKVNSLNVKTKQYMGHSPIVRPKVGESIQADYAARSSLPC